MLSISTRNGLQRNSHKILSPRKMIQGYPILSLKLKLEIIPKASKMQKSRIYLPCRDKQITKEVSLIQFYRNSGSFCMIQCIKKSFK